jgi:hypothetical protein
MKQSFRNEVKLRQNLNRTFSSLRRMKNWSRAANFKLADGQINVASLLDCYC